MSGTTRLLGDGTVAQGILSFSEQGDVRTATMLDIKDDCQMIEVAGPLIAGANQVTQLVNPSSNVNGADLYCLYTQVIQLGKVGNLAQSLIVAAKTAPTDFASKLNCVPIFRTFQDEKQSPVSLGGFAPMNVCNIRLPKNWGLWQVASITGDALTRNNVRIGIRFRPTQ